MRAYCSLALVINFEQVFHYLGKYVILMCFWWTLNIFLPLTLTMLSSNLSKYLPKVNNKDARTTFTYIILVTYVIVDIKQVFCLLSNEFSLFLHRPYFTYWVSFVQVVILIVMVSVYPFAPIGFSQKQLTKKVSVCFKTVLNPV